MRQRHITGTQLVQFAEFVDRVFDGMSSFDPEQRGDLTGGAGCLNIARRTGGGERFGVARDHRLHDLDLLERLGIGRTVIGGFRRHVHRPELSSHASLF